MLNQAEIKAVDLHVAGWSASCSGRQQPMQPPVTASRREARGRRRMSTDRICIIYIAGPSRAGSTLISRILGSLDGFFNCGEVIDIWDRGYLRGESCSCGSPFAGCAFWRSVCERVGALPVELAEIIKARDSAVRSKNVPAWILLDKIGLFPGRDLKVFSDLLGKFYRGIAEMSSADVLVDASKNVGYGFLLGRLPSVDLRVLHLIRDPRATAYSWQRKKEGLWQTRPLDTALMWNSRNLAAELMALSTRTKYMRVRYEDFVSNPSETIARVARLAGKADSAVSLPSGSELWLGSDHGISGNPNRFETGKTQIRIDAAWRTRMTHQDYVSVTALTWPMLLRYRYQLARSKPV